MVIHCKTSPTPAFTSQQQRAAPGEYPASASPRCMGSVHAQAQPSWKKGVRGVTRAERSRRHLPGGCWDHFATRAALSTQPLPQKS